jgi:hypothetical protein
MVGHACNPGHAGRENIRRLHPMAVQRRICFLKKKSQKIKRTPDLWDQGEIRLKKVFLLFSSPAGTMETTTHWKDQSYQYRVCLVFLLFFFFWKI